MSRRSPEQFRGFSKLASQRNIRVTSRSYCFDRSCVLGVLCARRPGNRHDLDSHTCISNRLFRRHHWFRWALAGSTDSR